MQTSNADRDENPALLQTFLEYRWQHRYVAYLLWRRRISRKTRRTLLRQSAFRDVMHGTYKGESSWSDRDRRKAQRMREQLDEEASDIGIENERLEAIKERLEGAFRHG